MKNIPNLLTLMRLLCVPLFVYCYFNISLHVALGVFLIASFTDFLDGYLARKYKVESTFGTVFDPLADKLLLISALVCLYVSHFIPLWVLTIILIKEVFMIIAGIIFYFKPEQVILPSDWLGKIATVVFTASITLVLLLPENRAVQYLLFIAVILKMISLISYTRFYFKKYKA